jgi:hypothetical protein
VKRLFTAAGAAFGRLRRNPTRLWRIAVLIMLAWIAMQQQQILAEMPEDMSFEIRYTYRNSERLKEIESSVDDVKRELRSMQILGVPRSY